VTIARAFTRSLAGILPAHAPAFIAAQIAGAVLATLLMTWLLRPRAGVEPTSVPRLSGS
jgi:glycerol uptake facilitator-like aquaporin